MQHNLKQTVCQLDAEGVSSRLTVKVNWHKNYFDLTIFDGTKAFTGTMKEEEISKIISQLGTLTAEEYFKECEAALSVTNGCENFVYLVKDNQFQWKKIVDPETKIMFGSIQLSVLPVVETLHDILNVLVKNNHQLEETTSHVNEEKTLLEKEYKDLLQRTDEYIRVKTDIESELCSQFLIVLNTKKKRISQLEKLLRANKIDVNDVVIEEEVTKNTITDLYECDTEVESDNDTTDDDSKEIPRKSNLETTRKKSGTFDSDSDSADVNLICDIPKRKKKLDKSVVDESETLFCVSNSYPRELNGRKNSSPSLLLKRVNERNYHIDEEAGPSGLKISKVEPCKTNICDEQNKTYSSETSSNETRFGSSMESNGDKILTNKPLKKVKEPEKEELVDDILANLFA